MGRDEDLIIVILRRYNQSVLANATVCSGKLTLMLQRLLQKIAEYRSGTSKFWFTGVICYKY